MFLAYMDESGDDGLPGSSPFFVLTTVYMDDRNWRSCFNAMRDFRQQLRHEFGIPMSIELHASHFMLNKHPFTNMLISDADRISIVTRYCRAVAASLLRVVNVVIDKRKVRDPATYDVLDKALTYAVQRIDNDMARNFAGSNFMLIVDDGRLAPMRSTTRRLQRINFVPSMFDGSAKRQDLQRMLEDPLTKDSKESYPIQIADMIARIVYLWVQYLEHGSVRGRTPAGIDQSQVERWLTELTPVLNLRAHTQNRFGIVTYPK